MRCIVLGRCLQRRWIHNLECVKRGKRNKREGGRERECVCVCVHACVHAARARMLGIVGVVWVLYVMSEMQVEEEADDEKDGSEGGGRCQTSKASHKETISYLD